jgi:hypothetical protein
MFMKIVSSLALAAALVTGSAVIAAPAEAKKKEQKEAAAPQLSAEERAALLPVETAIKAGDFAAAQAALPAAQAAAQSADAKFYVGTFQYQVGGKLKDAKLQQAGLEAVIGSGKVAAEELPKYYSQLGFFAHEAGDAAKADWAFSRAVELQPDNVEAIRNLAIVKLEMKQGNAALPLFDKAIALTKASGQPVPETLLKSALKTAYEARNAAETAKFSRALVEAYPTSENWRDALTIYRNNATLDANAKLDLLRLMRAAKAMKSEADYWALADLTNDRGLPGETKAVLEEGLAANVLSMSRAHIKDLLANAKGRVAEDKAALPGLEKKALAAGGQQALGTGDAYFGYGDYAKAAALYRAALKGGLDANMVNTRLGVALAMAGQKAEAEAALRAVSGDRAAIAQYWLLWLSQRG